jgi:phosphatidylglycerophosphatase A
MLNRLSKPIDVLVIALATWFGSGLLPKAPGTWGTLAAIPFVAAAAYYFSPATFIVITLVFTIASMPIAGRAAHLYRSNSAVHDLNPHKKPVFENDKLQQFIKDEDKQAKDPGMIVIDEVAGYAAAFMFLPVTITTIVLTFLFFRLFDIVKLPPSNLLEKIGGGAGIVLDDIMAGIYACLLTHGLLWLYGLTGFAPLP